MTRAEELAAIERHIAEKGVTRCPPAHANFNAGFMFLFRNRESAGVKYEPSDTEALRRGVGVPGGSVLGATMRRIQQHARSRLV